MIRSNWWIAICTASTASVRLRRSLLAVLLLAGLAGPGVLRAQDEKLPKGETILDKYVEVTGGKAAYDKLHNRVIKGTFAVPAQGLELTMGIYEASPNKTYMVLESDAIGKIEKGTEGDLAWELNPMTGPRLQEGEEKAVALRGATFDAVQNWRKLYKQAECVGLETIDGKPCYKVVLTAKAGPPETRYYDKESNLIVKTEMNMPSPMGSIPIESYASDYKRVDGILMAHKVRVLAMGVERNMMFESVEHNVKLPEDRFKLPAEIQALVDSAKEKPKTDTESGKPQKP
jgi:hypothetical protein